MLRIRIPWRATAVVWIRGQASAYTNKVGRYYRAQRTLWELKEKLWNRLQLRIWVGAEEENFLRKIYVKGAKIKPETEG